jgi:hypothetical protein
VIQTGQTQRDRLSCRIRRLARSVPVALLCGFVAACATAPRIATLKSQLSPADSFVAMPAGGPPIIAVLEKRFKDAVVRESILGTRARVSGQNFISVTLYGPVDYRTEDENALGEDSITPSQINREFGWYLYGVPMKRSTLYAQNRYGPFGFATGIAATGDRCLYAWQHIGMHVDQFLPRGSIGIRLRLCDSGATEQQLLAIMYGFTITGYLPSRMWNPYGKAPPPDPRIGEMSAPIIPPIEPTAAPPGPAPVRRVVVETVPAAPLRATRPAASDVPAIPLPEPTGDGRYATVPVPVE